MIMTKSRCQCMRLDRILDVGVCCEADKIVTISSIVKRPETRVTEETRVLRCQGTFMCHPPVNKNNHASPNCIQDQSRTTHLSTKTIMSHPTVYKTNCAPPTCQQKQSCLTQMYTRPIAHHPPVNKTNCVTQLSTKPIMSPNCLLNQSCRPTVY